MTEPPRPQPGAETNESLVRALRREIADGLTERLRADEAAGNSRMSQADQRLYGRQLINKRLEVYAKERMERGREPLSFEDETALSQAVEDALFGPGSLQGPAQRQAKPSPTTTQSSQRRKSKGDVHVGTMAGDVRRVPGSGTTNGDKAIADYMRDVLERVRRSIRERTNRH